MLVRSGQPGEKKILHPTGTRNSNPSVVHPVASRYTDYAMPAPKRREQTEITTVYSYWDETSHICQLQEVKGKVVPVLN
jgi:hypothetical protein